MLLLSCVNTINHNHPTNDKPVSTPLHTLPAVENFSTNDFQGTCGELICSLWSCRYYHGPGWTVRSTSTTWHKNDAIILDADRAAIGAQSSKHKKNQATVERPHNIAPPPWVGDVSTVLKLDSPFLILTFDVKFYLRRQEKLLNKKQTAICVGGIVSRGNCPHNSEEMPNPRKECHRQRAWRLFHLDCVFILSCSVCCWCYTVLSEKSW